MKILYHPDKNDIHLPNVLQALSDPVRLYILHELYRSGECTCGDIDVPVVKSTLSHHARTLREAGVIRVRTSGTQRFLSIRKEELEERFPGLLHAILEAYQASGASIPLGQET